MSDDLKEGLPVPGYVPQPQDAIDLVAANKEFEERLLRCIDRLTTSFKYDSRWLSIARTHFEEGFMALNRAIFKPQRIKLPGD
jgi:hypothetical protein